MADNQGLNIENYNKVLSNGYERSYPDFIKPRYNTTPGNAFGGLEFSPNPAIINGSVGHVMPDITLPSGTGDSTFKFDLNTNYGYNPDLNKEISADVDKYITTTKPGYGPNAVNTKPFDFKTQFQNSSTKDNASVFSWGHGGDYYQKGKNGAPGQWMNKELIGDDKVLGLEDMNKAQFVTSGGSEDEYALMHPNESTSSVIGGTSDSKAFGNYVNAGLGVVNMGFGIASYFDNKEVQGKQIALLDQQIQDNNDRRADKKQYKKDSVAAWGGTRNV